MQLLAVGQSPVGVIAIGQVPVGVLAIGQGARGVVAIGQLACGVIAVGQLAVGIVAFGQLTLGAVWAGGMLALGAVCGPALLGFGGIGALRLRDMLHGRLRRFERRPAGPLGLGLTGVIVAAALAIVMLAGVRPLLDEPTRTDVEAPRQLR